MAKRDKLNRDKKLFLDAPVEPFQATQNLSVDELLRRMEAISFQGRNLATASRVWERMIEDQVFIFLGLAGALSAGGLRLTVAVWWKFALLIVSYQRARISITICTKREAVNTFSVALK